MASNYSFSVMPSVSISRSRFARKSQHKTSLKHGYITPIYVDEVLPGDTRSIDMASLVRMSTPIAPIMDNIEISYFAFFCPMRLLWDHAKEFFGENKESAGIPSKEYTIPCVHMETDTSRIDVGSLWDHFGLPIGVYNGSGEMLKVSALPFRMYYLCYNEWFRNQNVIAPIAINTSDNDGVFVGGDGDTFEGGDGNYSGLPLMKAAKLADYFTKALPYAQKGAAVSIPLGTTAPILGNVSIGSGVPKVAAGGFMTTSGTTNTPGVAYNMTDGTFYKQNTEGTNLQLSPYITTSTMVADLSQATAATINQLRYAFQLQKLLEKDALYGSRYWEILASHFSVQSPDASLQRPEYLGGFKQHINIDQVLSTAGYAPSSSTTVGAPGANSVTGAKGSLFTKSFTEHGYLMILAVPRAEHTYSQGVNRMWLRKGRYDFYWPVFANLGAQDVKLIELWTGINENEGGRLSNLDEVFGYQESWAEYRYKPSVTSGYLRPQADNSLDFWTLTDDYQAKPTLGQTFIEEPREFIDRALVTGNSTDEYICDFFFEDIAVRPMPVYSIPGLIDHH